MADVLFVPPAPTPYLADAKSATSVHADPSQDSVFALFGDAPPNIKVEVLVPDPPKNRLAVFTSVVSVQDDPFQDSTFVILLEGGAAPDDAKAAVELP
jgi:hypothetical protein